MDEHEAGAVDTARVAAAVDGDDIEVLPDPVPRRRGTSRVVFVGATALVVFAAVAVIALASHHDTPKARVHTSSPLPTTRVVAKVHTKSTVPLRTQQKIAAISIPATFPTASVAPTVVSAPTAPPAPTTTPTTAAVTQLLGPSSLIWDAPSTFTLAAGTTKTLTVTAHNRSAGTVALPHPLSCAPRLDHTEVCAETVQLVTAGQSASAQYTIDARGIAPGRYTLTVEGVFGITVTVTKA